MLPSAATFVEWTMKGGTALALLVFSFLMLVVVFSLLMIFALVYDKVFKRKKIKEHLQTGAKNVSESDRVYTEHLVHETYRDMNGPY